MRKMWTGTTGVMCPSWMVAVWPAVFSAMWPWMCMQDDQEEMRKLIRMLGDQEPERREKASSEILTRWETWSREALTELKKARNAADPEVAVRAHELAQRVEVRRRLGRRLLEVCPEIEENIPEDVNEWMPLFVRVTELIRSGNLRRKDVQGLVNWARSKGALRPEVALAYLKHITEFRVRAYSNLVASMMRSAEPGIRAAAIDCAGRIELYELLPSIEDFLRDPSSQVRGTAVRVIGDLRGRKQAGAVAQCLLDPEPSVRILALKTLRQLRTVAAPELMVRCLEDQDPRVRIEAVRTLVKLQMSRAYSKVAALVRDKDPAVAEAVRGAVIATGNEELLGTAARLVSAADARSRELAALAIGRLREPNLNSALLELAQDSDKRVQLAALRSLISVGEASLVGRAVNALLHSREGEVLQMAFEAATKTRCELRDARLIGQSLHHDSTRVILAALRYLQTVPTRALRGELIRCLGHSEAAVRAEALRALGALGDAEVIDKIRTSLSDVEPTVRCAAVEALARLNLSGSAPSMVPLLADEANEVARTAEQVLARAPWDRIAVGIHALLNHEDEQVRKRALCVGSRAGGVEFLGEIRRMVSDPSELVVARALTELSRLGEGLDILQDTLSDGARSEFVRRSAFQALGSWRAGSIGSVISELAKSDDAYVRLHAALLAGLRHCGELDSSVFDLLDDEDPLIRRAAVSAVRKSGTQQGLDRIAGLLKDNTSWVRFEAARTLFLAGKKLSADRVRGLIEDPYEDCKIIGLQFVQAWQMSELYPLLGRLLDADSVSEPVKRATLEAVARIGLSKYGKVIERLLRASKSAGLREAAVRALARISAPEHKAVLEEMALEDVDKRVRISARAALLTIGEYEWIDPVRLLAQIRGKASTRTGLFVLRCMNHRFEGPLAKDLNSETMGLHEVEVALEDLAAMLKEKGVQLRVPPSHMRWSAFVRNPSTIAQVLEAILEPRGYCPVLQGRIVWVMPPEEAFEVWLRRLD